MDEKKKHVTYILLLIVLLVWGIIFYKFFSDLSSNPDQPKLGSISMTKDYKADTVDENFELLPIYNDPFLGFSYSGGAKVARPLKMAKKNVLAKDVKFPVVTYFGMINNASQARKIGLIQMEGSDHVILKGQVINGIKVIYIDKDSIVIEKEKVTKRIRKQ